MKTIELEVYEFSELLEKAKEKAFNKYCLNDEYFWGNDAIKSLKGFMEHFNCKLSNYQIDWLEKYRNEIEINIPEYMNSISENELKDYIEDMGTYNKETLNGDGDCKFTGYCADEDACDGARKAFFEGERNLYNILYAGYETWYSACQKDAEYQFSYEGFTEHCKFNEYFFDENGRLI